MYKSYSMELAGRTLTVDIDRVAKQANGAALCIMVIPLYFLLQPHQKSQEKELIFSPLSVEYEEKMYAVGKSREDSIREKEKHPSMRF